MIGESLSFVPAQPCDVGMLPPPVTVKEVAIRKGGLSMAQGGLPVVGSLDIHRDIVSKKIDGARQEQAEPKAESKPEALSLGPAAVKFPEVPAAVAPAHPIERAVAQRGPKPENCEERCRELEEENRALTRVIARLQTENDRLRASRA